MFALSDAALIALLATIPVLTTALGAMGLAWITGRQRRAERAEDRDERQEVAAAAALLLVTNKKIAASTETVVSGVAELKVSVGEVQESNTTIHKFLNSDKTEGMQEKLDGRRRERVMMKEIMGLKGGDPSPEAVQALAEIDVQIETLSEAVEERRRQQIIADAEAKQKADRP